MATLSRSRLVSCIAKSESSWGSDASPAGGTDDVTVIDSENPWSPNIESTSIRPHTASFTKQVKNVIGAQLAGVSLQGLMQGPATKGTPDNGTNGMIALWKSAGLHNTNTTGGANDVVTWTPATKAQAVSATVEMDLDGYVCQVLGCFGSSLELFGDTGANAKPRWRYTGVGKYVEPAIGTISSVAAPDRATSALGGTASITPSGGSAYTCASGLVLNSWNIRFNSTIGSVRSVCESTAIKELIYADRTAQMTLQLAVDVNDSANLDIEDIHGDLIAQTTHLVTLTWGTDPYAWKINVPTAELMSISPPSTVDGYRVITVTYDLFHATANSEITIAVGNPA